MSLSIARHWGTKGSGSDWTMQPLAYSYLRMSTAQQASGDSVRRQTAARNAYLEKHGLQLPDAFEDLGVSAHRGRHRTHGALSRFLALVNSGRVSRGSILLIEDIDRLSREPVIEAFGLFSGLLMAGIKIVTLNNGW